MRKMWKSFEIFFIEEECAKSSRYHFLDHHAMARCINSKFISSSPNFLSNNNVESAVVVLLSCLGMVNIEITLENLHGNNLGRKKSNPSLSILRDVTKSDNEKNEAVKSKLLNDPDLKHHGHNIIRKLGDEAVLGIIRYFKRINENGNR